jgi:hypothetical protein
MKTIKDWYNALVEITRETEYEVLIREMISNPVVAIVPKNFETPQRIAIYPKKTKNAGLVIENDIFHIPNIKDLLGEPKRIKSNRPHYNDVTDEIILEVCKIFLSLN